jgi:hypothetical protein
VAVEVDAISAEPHPFGTQTPALCGRAVSGAGGDPPPGPEDTMPGDLGGAGPGKGPQRPSHRPGPAGHTEKGRDLAVGGDTSLRNLLDEGVHPLEEARPRSRWGQVCRQACGGVRG